MTKVALVGYGYWGPNVAKQLYNNPEVDFWGICDKKEDRLAKAKRIYVNELQYTTQYDDVLNDNSIEAVALAVETSAHFEIAKRAIEAGKHVYVEKPFTSTSKEAEELRVLAGKRNRIIHVDHIMMYHPYIQKIKQLYDSGEIGDIIYFDASRMNLGQVKSDVNAMWDLAIHDLSIIDYLFNPGDPVNIHAIGQKSINTSEVCTIMLLKYKKFIANIKSNWISPIKERKIILAGTKKMVVYDDVSLVEKLKIYNSGLVVENTGIEYDNYVIKTRTGDILSPDVKMSDALYNSVNHFIDCVKSNKQSLSGPDQGIRLLRTLEEGSKLL